MLETLGLYWHTLRTLKPVQLYGRLWFRLYRPAIRDTSVPARRSAAAAWQAPVTKPRSLLAPYEFRFLNETRALPPVGGWNNPAWEKLWRYNLHYFDDLTSEHAAQRTEWHRALLARWVAENPPAHGEGWDPYPVSLRIVNWVKWALEGNNLSTDVQQSLAVQARWLRRRLEWHLLGNHLFTNAKALIVAGLFFKGEEADAWLRRGSAILSEELREQILSDGGHFERSPMYHAIVLEDLLDMINAATTYAGSLPANEVAKWKQTASLMLEWLFVMSHPDGEIAYFNDAALGIAAKPAALLAYAQRLQLTVKTRHPRLVNLDGSGYVRVEQDDAVVLLDVAPVGPDYLAAHAHADTLSFELSCFGQRVIVHRGTSRYGVDPVRLAERQTAAHNTVEVDGLSSSEVWSGFRTARRAYPYDLLVREDATTVYLACSHDGYARLPGKPVHRREWTFTRGALLVTDTVSERKLAAIARFHVHPDLRIERATATRWDMHLAYGRVISLNVMDGSGTLEPSYYAPEFGITKPTSCLAVELRDGIAQTRISWIDEATH